MYGDRCLYELPSSPSLHKGGLPFKQQLDAIVGDRPAYMEAYDGHSGWANSKALAMAGFTKDLVDPDNGVIVRPIPAGEFWMQEVGDLGRSLRFATGAVGRDYYFTETRKRPKKPIGEGRGQ